MKLELLTKLKVMGDERGALIPLEQNKDVPFDIKRVFYLFDTQKGVERGVHAHYQTKQLLIAVNGCCKIELDNGAEKKIIELDSRNLGLFQNKLVWGNMYDFSEDCVLMVLASELYDPDDYIRDYDEFLKCIKLGTRL